ncbi:MAG: DUF5131 family protein [Sedimentisphaerales bacterium]|jgi:protein gp37
MDNKRIGKYWDESWNPIIDSRGGYHCTKCSPGCANCWAEKINLLKFKDHPYDGTPVEFAISEKVMNGKITQPRPHTFFVCDLCDLFHRDVNIELQDRIFVAMKNHPQHKFLVLTKRPENALRYHFVDPWENRHFIPDNVWYGISVCLPAEKEKIDILRRIPAIHRWVSFGPLLGNMGEINLEGINWVIIEEESLGWRPGRPSSPSGNGWHNCVKPIVEQCKAAGIPLWVKQIHYQGRLLKNIEELPVDVRVRERPF